MTMRKRGEDGDIRGRGRACWWSWQKDGFVESRRGRKEDRYREESARARKGARRMNQSACSQILPRCMVQGRRGTDVTRGQVPAQVGVGAGGVPPTHARFDQFTVMMRHACNKQN